MADISAVTAIVLVAAGCSTTTYQQINYLQLLYIGQEWKALRDRSDTLMRQFPEEIAFYELNNAARYSMKDYAGIIRNGEERIRQHPADTSVTIPTYAMIGDMYHSLGDEKKSFKAYEKVLKLNPDYVPPTDLESEFDIPVLPQNNQETDKKTDKKPTRNRLENRLETDKKPTKNRQKAY